MHIHFLQHVHFETPGYLVDWTVKNNHSYSSTHLYENDALPSSDDFDFLVIMGGPMNIYEEEKYQWLKAEKQLIRQAIVSGKKVLGICLGSQLVADVLGAKVYPNKYPEIGWFPVFKNEFSCCEYTRFMQREIPTFHWHGDTFDLPADSVRLFSSEATLNQAFSYNENVLALQFHWEMKKENMLSMLQFSGNDLKPGKYIQEKAGILVEEKVFTKMNEHLDEMLQRFTSKM